MPEACFQHDPSPHCLHLNGEKVGVRGGSKLERAECRVASEQGAAPHPNPLPAQVQCAGRGGSHSDFDDRDLGNGAVAEALQVDLELVSIETDRHVELEAGGDGAAGRRGVAGAKGDDAG